MKINFLILSFLFCFINNFCAEENKYNLSLPEAYEDVIDSSVPYQEMHPNFSFYNMLKSMRFSKRGFKKSLDTHRYQLGSLVERSVTWADGLFGDIDPKNYENRSYLTLGSFYNWSETDVINVIDLTDVTDVTDVRNVSQFRMRLKSKIHLPLLKKRFKLIVSSTQNSLFKEEISGTEDNFDNIEDDSRNSNAFATALGWTFKQTKKVFLDFKTGMRINFPLQPYLKGRFIRSFDLGNKWVFKFEENLFAILNDENGSTTAFSFSRRLSENRTFNTRTFGFISNLEDFSWKNFRWQHSYSYFQDLGSDRSYSLHANISGITETKFRLEVYRLGVHYRQKFFRPWLHIYASPALSFPRSKDWQSVAQFRIGLDAIISTRNF